MCHDLKTMVTTTLLNTYDVRDTMLRVCCDYRSLFHFKAFLG